MRIATNNDSLRLISDTHDVEAFIALTFLLYLLISIRDYFSTENVDEYFLQEGAPETYDGSILT